MRMIERATIFKRDYKRELKGQYKKVLDTVFKDLVTKLMNDIPLEKHHHDHRLSGEWAGYRECHVKPDLLLIYRKVDDHTLFLARLGTHSLLF